MKSYKTIGYCDFCGKPIEKVTRLRNHLFCSRECSREYRTQILAENNSRKKLTYSGIEIGDPVVIYEQFIYKYYYWLYCRPKEERMSDAWYCYYLMFDNENINDASAFFRAIRQFAYSEKLVKHYEITNIEE